MADLNRCWCELNSGHRISVIQRHAVHRTMSWMAATLDGRVKQTGAVFKAKFMLPWSFSDNATCWSSVGTKKSVLSIINGGSYLSIEADPIDQTILIVAKKAAALRREQSHERRLSFCLERTPSWPRDHCEQCGNCARLQ
jgi:hypothetical protein